MFVAIPKEVVATARNQLLPSPRLILSLASVIGYSFASVALSGIGGMAVGVSGELTCA